MTMMMLVEMRLDSLLCTVQNATKTESTYVPPRFLAVVLCLVPAFEVVCQTFASYTMRVPRSAC